MQYHFSYFTYYSLQDDDFKFDETTVQLPMPFSPSMAPNTTEVPLNIAIVDDQVSEERECFTCIIHNSSLPEKERRCSSPTTTICIVGPGEYRHLLIFCIIW